MTFQREKLYNKEEINTLAICVWCLRLGSAEPAAHPAADATAEEFYRHTLDYWKDLKSQGCYVRY